MMLAFVAAALPPAGFAAEAAPPAAQKPKAKARSKSKNDKKKNYDYEKSKYKAYRALTDSEPRTYRFDEKGNPIPPPPRRSGPPRRRRSPSLPKRRARARPRPKGNPSRSSPDAASDVHGLLVAVADGLL